MHATKDAGHDGGIPGPGVESAVLLLQQQIGASADFQIIDDWWTSARRRPDPSTAQLWGTPATIALSAATWPSNAVRPSGVRRARTRRRRSETGRSIVT